MKGNYGDTEIERFCSSGTQSCMESSKMLGVQSDSKAKPKIMVGVFLLEVISSVKLFCFFFLH